jgi:hypothetical protein
VYIVRNDGEGEVSKTTHEFEQYSAWRRGVSTALEQFQAWVKKEELTDGATDQRISRALARLADDKLSIAFVAEFSRGKSELINAPPPRPCARPN